MELLAPVYRQQLVSIDVDQSCLFVKREEFCHASTTKAVGFNFNDEADQ